MTSSAEANQLEVSKVAEKLASTLVVRQKTATLRSKQAFNWADVLTSSPMIGAGIGAGVGGLVGAGTEMARPKERRRIGSGLLTGMLGGGAVGAGLGAAYQFGDQATNSDPLSAVKDPSGKPLSDAVTEAAQRAARSVQGTDKSSIVDAFTRPLGFGREANPHGLWSTLFGRPKTLGTASALASLWNDWRKLPTARQLIADAVATHRGRFPVLDQLIGNEPLTQQVYNDAHYGANMARGGALRPNVPANSPSEPLRPLVEQSNQNALDRAMIAPRRQLAAAQDQLHIVRSRHDIPQLETAARDARTAMEHAELTGADRGVIQQARRVSSTADKALAAGRKAIAQVEDAFTKAQVQADIAEQQARAAFAEVPSRGLVREMSRNPKGGLLNLKTLGKATAFGAGGYTLGAVIDHYGQQAPTFDEEEMQQLIAANPNLEKVIRARFNDAVSPVIKANTEAAFGKP